MKRWDDETVEEWSDRIGSQLEFIETQAVNLNNNLQIQFFDAGAGIIVTDERTYGIPRIEVGIDPIYQTQIDYLTGEVMELRKTNDLLVKYIQEHLNK